MNGINHKMGLLTDEQRAQVVIGNVKHKTIPQILYKYREFDGFAESIFKNSSLFFSKPSDFNDPFDCRITDKGNYTSQEIIDYLVGCGMPKQDAVTVALQNAANPNKMVSTLERIRAEVFDCNGILCLSECPDSILMWSYYSKSHSGFALGFDVLEDPPFFIMPLPIRYVRDYPAFRYLVEKEKLVERGMISKSKFWKHEKEIRVCKRDGPGLYKFSKKCLAEVIFGCRTKDTDRNKIIKCLKDYGYNHVKVKRTVPSRTSYKLEIQDLTIA
ncbi:MAG: DUF2971 domain-containing protein [Verrucomicrobiia bacterium]